MSSENAYDFVVKVFLGVFLGVLLVLSTINPWYSLSGLILVFVPMSMDLVSRRRRIREHKSIQRREERYTLWNAIDAIEEENSS